MTYTNGGREFATWPAVNESRAQCKNWAEFDIVGGMTGTPVTTGFA
jgi:hypothetical protein